MEIITCLAAEFGWTRHYILNELYWEEVWIYFKKTYNEKAVDWNIDKKWLYMVLGTLHLDKKQQGKWRHKWKDAKLPFPGKKVAPKVSGARHRLFATQTGQKLSQASKDKYNATHRRHRHSNKGR